MKVQFYRPRNKILQKHIKGYYFISENEASAPINYLTFPTNYCILSTSYNSDVFFEMNKIIVLPSSQEEINTDLVFRFTKPIEVYYENPINEITIYFKPLGLNNYVNNLNELFTKRKNVEDYNPFPDFKEKMNVIFKIKNRDQQIEELENYWISKLQIEDLSLMELILSDLTADFKINDIAKKT